MGTTNITAKGRLQLSYCAASTKNTNITARPNTIVAVLPDSNWRNESSVHSKAMFRGRFLFAMVAISCADWPELKPLALFPYNAVAGYML